MKTYKNKLKSVDIPLLTVTLLLIGFGIIAVLSASYPVGTVYHKGDGLFFFKRHLAFVFLGFITMIVVMKIPRNVLRTLAKPLFIISVFSIFLLWTGLGSGAENKGQARWLIIPFIKFKFQPSDLLKLSSILFMAKMLEDYRNSMNDSKVFMKLTGILIIAVVPIMMKDFSTAVVIGVTLFTMYFVGGIRMHQAVTLVAMGITGFVAMIFVFPYRMKRIFGFINIFTGKKADMLSDNWQITQALYAIAMGGFGGVGIFRSRQKYLNLSDAYNDFIFAIICEEIGFIGAMILMLLFALYIYRGFLIASRCKNYFDKYTAIGITTYIAIQAIFHMGVSVQLFPVTGITLPFISYGGTSLIITMACSAILLKISRGVK